MGQLVYSPESRWPRASVSRRRPLAEESAPPPNILIVEASQLIRAAEDARAPEEKIPLLEDARGKLQSVIDNHPASDLALKLATGQSIGAISLPAVDRALETALEGCWNSPTVDCVSRLVLKQVESSGDCYVQKSAYLALADASIALGNFGKADSAIERVKKLYSYCAGWVEQSSVAALSSIVSRDLSADQLARVSELLAHEWMFSSDTQWLMRGLRENGFFSTAAEIAEAAISTEYMWGEVNTPFAWALARGKHELTRDAEGTESFGEAKRIAAQTEDSVEGAELLARVAWEQAKSGAATDALATANALEELVLGLADEHGASNGHLDVLVDVARTRARATGNKADAMPVLLQAIDLGSRSSDISVGTLERLAYRSLWFTAADEYAPEALLRLTERAMRMRTYSHNSVMFNYACSVWAAVHSASRRLGDPMAAFRRLEAELSGMGFRWDSRGKTTNCVGDGIQIASLIEHRHDDLPSSFQSNLIFALLDLLEQLPDYRLDDGAIAIIVNENEPFYAVTPIEHQLEGGFAQQARSLAQQVTQTPAADISRYLLRPDQRIISRLVRSQLRLGLPRQAEAVLARALAVWREDCLTASAERDCHIVFNQLLTSAAVLEGARAK